MPGKVEPKRPARRVSKALGEGVKELPSNATWLLSKAVGPLGPRSGGSRAPSVTGLLDIARSAGATVMEAVPGGDSVELRLQRARAAVADAQEAEERAVQESLEAERETQDAEQVAKLSRVRPRRRGRAGSTGRRASRRGPARG